MIAPYVIQNSGFSKFCDISLLRSSYYNVPRNYSLYDFIIMCEALMMAEYPDKLLKEVKRIIKNDGVLFVVGEPRVNISLRGGYGK